MSYPVGQGTKQDFDTNWKVDGGFGDWREEGKYYHEGLDINARTGGDSDLGLPLRCIKQGEIVYYHNNSHPSANFGRHIVYRISTPRGDRWIHYAHCSEIVAEARSVSEGEVVGKIGKSGTAVSHLHCSVFKVDPSTLRSGIDTVAKTKEELNLWWEDPFMVFNDVTDESNTYRGYDLTNRDSMKICVDDHLKIVEGQVIDRAQYEAVKGQYAEASKSLDTLRSNLATANSTIQALTNKVGAQTDIIGKYNNEDAVQLIQLKESYEKATTANKLLWDTLRSFADIVKYSIGSDDAPTIITGVTEALQSQIQTITSLQNKIRELESVGDTHEKPIEKTTLFGAIIKLVNSLFGR